MKPACWITRPITQQARARRGAASLGVSPRAAARRARYVHGLAAGVQLGSFP